jgi:hypothetical protein
MFSSRRHLDSMAFLAAVTAHLVLADLHKGRYTQTGDHPMYPSSHATSQDLFLYPTQVEEKEKERETERESEECNANFLQVSFDTRLHKRSQQFGSAAAHVVEVDSGRKRRVQTYGRMKHNDSEFPWDGAFNGTWIYLHIGKTGGTTLNQRASELNLELQQIHPKPVPMNASEFRNVLISVRDPVDRFVAAFNWRCTLLCNETDSRIRITNSGRGIDYSRFCKDRLPRESKLLNAKYSRNVSKLAEALCSSSDTVRNEAQVDISKIKHLEYSISDWIEALNLKSKELVLPLVMETGFDFNAQADEAFAWMLKVAPPHLHVTPNQFPKSNNADYAAASSAYDSPALTEDGAKCLSQYYADDYAQLEWLRSSCHGQDEICRLPLQSILNRRL